MGMNAISCPHIQDTCARLARVADDANGTRAPFDPSLLRQRRLAAGVPDAVLAVIVGCSVSAVAKWEAGRSAPSPSCDRESSV